MLLLKEKASVPEAAISPDIHEGNVRALLKQARMLSDDVYTRAYKIHQAIMKYTKTAYDTDLAETAKDLALFTKAAIAIKNREIQRRG
jgi:hypothetical protein